MGEARGIANLSRFDALKGRIDRATRARASLSSIVVPHLELIKCILRHMQLGFGSLQLLALRGISASDNDFQGGSRRVLVVTDGARASESVLGHALRDAKVVDDAFLVSARLLGFALEKLEVGELILAHDNWVTGQAPIIVFDILVVEDGERSCVCGRAGERDVTTNRIGVDGRFIA